MSEKSPLYKTQSELREGMLARQNFLSNRETDMSKTARERMPQVILDTICILTFFTLALFSVNTALAEAIPDSLTKKLAEFKGAERGQIVSLKEDSLIREFPGFSFYVLRFRTYPVARLPPEPLKINNLFIVKPDGSVEHIVEPEGLKKFFRTALVPVTAQARARDVAKAWLQLSQEFYQDDFFHFSIPEDSLQVAAKDSGGVEVSAKAVVNQQGGNSGEIAASLTFDPAGVLTNVSESVQIHRGIRPICQATKLLDPDPIVRGMAEQDILVMGKAAKGYLDEQRAKTRPELQQAIDEIWQRIVAEGR